MSRLEPSPMVLDVLGYAVVLPDERIPVDQLEAEERERIDAQLAMLTRTFRDRLIANLGIVSVASFGKRSSADAGVHAARAALAEAGLAAARVGLIVDYSTYAADCPDIWSLAQEVQHELRSNALSLSVRGSGCAGLHSALLVAKAMLIANPELEAALLVAADRAPDGGRSCLPVSYMADAASALVVGRAGTRSDVLGRIHGIEVQQVGRFSRLLVAEDAPPRMSIDASTFEQKVLPLHFVMLHRVLARALGAAGWQMTDLDAIVYPNTTALDRSGVARGFGFSAAQLPGPEPNGLGHAFANDMLINAAALLAATTNTKPKRTVWLAAGSGFSWGAAIVELGTRNAVG